MIGGLFTKVMSVLILTIAVDVTTMPLDAISGPSPLQESTSDQQSKPMKRSPLEVGFVSFGISHLDRIHQLRDSTGTHLSSAENADLTVPVHVSHSSSNIIIKPPSSHGDHYIEHNNLVRHDVHQTRDHSTQVKEPTHVIIALNHQPEIIHNDIVHEHVEIKTTKVNSEVNHLPEHFVPVVPVTHHILVTNHPVKSEVTLKTTHEKLEDLPVALAQRSDDEERSHFRDPIGGYGVGLSFGGYGAGHGFFAG